MFKKYSFILVLIVMLGALVFGPVIPAQARPDGASVAVSLQHNRPPSNPGSLSQAEIDGLDYMREEEKLAHDVYVTMYAQWGLSIFANISQSETMHTNMVKNLLVNYGLPDPATNQVGTFTNQILQGLYDELIPRGRQSISEALKVGGAVEEIDILDLQKRLAETDNADIQQIYTHLMNGSFNHLRAFVSTLASQTGETYQPQFLTQDAYQAIINGSGGGGGGGGGCRCGRN